MSGEPKVELCRLFERTSAAGNRYMFGRLGAAKIIAFAECNGELPYGAEAAWTLYVQAADPPSQDAAQPRRAPARRTARPKPPADDGDPRPFDDSLEDIG